MQRIIVGLALLASGCSSPASAPATPTNPIEPFASTLDGLVGVTLAFASGRPTPGVCPSATPANASPSIRAVAADIANVAKVRAAQMKIPLYAALPPQVPEGQTFRWPVYDVTVWRVPGAPLRATSRGEGKVETSWWHASRFAAPMTAFTAADSQFAGVVSAYLRDTYGTACTARAMGLHPRRAELVMAADKPDSGDEADGTLGQLSIDATEACRLRTVAPPFSIPSTARLTVHVTSSSGRRTKLEADVATDASPPCLRSVVAEPD